MGLPRTTDARATALGQATLCSPVQGWRIRLGTPHPPEHRTSSPVMFKSSARMRSRSRDEKNRGPSMDRSQDGEPLSVRGKQMRDGNQPEEQCWHACRRERRGEIAEDRHCEQERIEQGVHAPRRAPLPHGEVRVPVRTADPGTNAEAVERKPEYGEADCLMELIEQKFQQELAERHGDHQPSEREGRKHEPSRPPVDAP